MKLLGATEDEFANVIVVIGAAFVGLVIGLSDTLDGNGTAFGAIGFIVAGLALSTLWWWAQ